MREAHLIVVGKLKDKHIEALESEYLKRLKRPRLQIHEVKSHSEQKDLEAKEVLKKIGDLSSKGSVKVILLAENGEIFDSPKFSKWIFKQGHNIDSLIFVIGGAAGHGQEVIERSEGRLSLSPLTYPHKLARLLFVEQFYRACTINEGHPYHK